jgi:hypothetical protein
MNSPSRWMTCLRLYGPRPCFARNEGTSMSFDKSESSWPSTTFSWDECERASETAYRIKSWVSSDSGIELDEGVEGEEAGVD